MNARLNALMIAPFMPDRTGTGAQQRAANLLDALRSRADVTLWILRGDASPSQVNGPCDRVVHFPLSGPTAKKLGPPAAERSSRREIALELRRPLALAASTFDLVVCFRLQSAVFLERAEVEIGPLAQRRITDLDDVESVLAQRLGKLRARPKARQSAKTAREVRRLRRAEDRCLAVHDLVLVASPVDELVLRKRRGNLPLALAPNSVAWPEETPPRRRMSDHIVITFVGNFGYFPNIDGMKWFSKSVLPELVRLTDRDFRVDIVGFNSHRLPKFLHQIPRVRIVGPVSSVGPTYQESDIVIAPVRAGSGTRIKILEAMSYGLPVVSTSVGAEGIQAVRGEDVIIANGAIAFARSCAHLMAHEPLRQAIGARARSLIQTKYALDVVLPMLERTIFE